MSNKSRFRVEALESIKRQSRVNGKLADKKIAKEVISQIKKRRVKSLFGYIALESEVETKTIFDYCRRNKILVYVPFMEGKSFRLVKYRLPFRKKRFGIKEPKFSRQYRVRDIDLAIVPVLGIDLTCRRVGFGKGMYDRFFEKEGMSIKKVIFLQRVICYSPQKITQKHDIRADEIITRGVDVLEF